jgi:predicted HTH transcriptional regulator
MSDFQNEMNRAVESFVAQITDLARRAAMDTLESAFGARAGRAGGARVALASAMTAVARVGRPRGGRGAKRTAEDIEAMSSKFSSFVKANPGLRIEQINKELGTTTKDLALPIRKLIAEGMISAKGKKRSTAYFPGRKAKN